MHISDLPLPLRLRNALLKAGFNTDDDLRTWGDGAIPGVGPTGMQQLTDWLNDDRLVKAVETHVPQLELAPREAETPEESIARAAPRHEVVKMVDTAMRSDGRGEAAARPHHDQAMRGGLEKLEKLHDAEFRHRTDVLTSRGGSVVVENGRGLLALRLEADIQARITALIPTIKALPHVKELGVDVSAETVGRMALIRGLDALERAHKTAPKAENGAKPAEIDPNEAVPVVSEDTEVYETPEGWAKVGPGEAIPIPEAVLHDYYTQNGWNRYWGRVDDQTIYFYWSPEKRLQDLKPFPGTDKSGRRVAEQATPWGPGHVVPTKWANS